MVEQKLTAEHKEAPGSDDTQTVIVHFTSPDIHIIYIDKFLIGPDICGLHCTELHSYELVKGVQLTLVYLKALEKIKLKLTA